MSCKHHIVAVMKEANRPLFLHEIAARVYKRSKRRYSETGVSARVRNDVRPMLWKEGLDYKSAAPEGMAAHRYWLVKLPRGKK